MPFCDTVYNTCHNDIMGAHLSFDAPKLLISHKLTTEHNISNIGYKMQFEYLWFCLYKYHCHRESFISYILVALHCKPLSRSVGEWAELQTSVALRLASLLRRENEMWTVKVRYGKNPASQRVWKFMSILWAVIAMVKNPIWN